MFTILYFLLVAISGTPTPKHEQLAADYFFDVVWKEKYVGYKSIEFRNRTDTGLNVGPIMNCTGWSKELIEEFQKGKATEFIELNSSPTNISIKRISKSKRLKLYVGTKIEVRDGFVVRLHVYRPYYFVDYYLIKFDREGRITDRCDTSEII